MTLYGADIEALRAFGRQLDAGADSFDSVRRGLESSVAGTSWPGPDGAQFRGQWSGQLSPSLASVSTILRDAANRIRANADDQERTSTDGGTGAGTGIGGAVGRAIDELVNGSGSGSGSETGTGSNGGDGLPTITLKGDDKTTVDNGGIGQDATEGRTGKIGGSFSYDPETGLMTYGGTGSISDWMKFSNGSKLSFGLTGGAEVSAGEHSADGFTTYTSKQDVSIGVEGGFETKTGTGISGGLSTGVTSEYTIKVPDGAGEVDPRTINPFDPRSMPIGSTVTMNGGDYAKTDLDTAFRHIALESSVKDASGVSSIIERVDEDVVRVTAGPTEALTNSFGLGVDIHDFKAMLGNTTTLGGASLHTAEFDLSTAEGQAAYDSYLVTGEIPAEPSTGISGVTTIQKVTYDSESSIELSSPVGGFEWGLGETNMNMVNTTYPDGTSEQLATVSYPNRGDFHLTQSWDASGGEDVSQRVYSWEIAADDLTAQYLNGAGEWFPRGVVSEHVTPGETVTVSFTEAQLEGLSQRIAEAEHLTLPRWVQEERWTTLNLARVLSVQGSDAQMIVEISNIYTAQERAGG